MAFKIGERVKFLNEKGGAVIVEIKSNDLIEVRSDDGFNYVLPNSELVGEGISEINKQEIQDKLDRIVAESTDRQALQEMTNKHLLPDYLMKSKKNWTSRDKDFIEVDLHIEEIVDKPKLLSDGEKLNYQLEHARLCLDEALEFKVKRIIFIHGVGAGVLRNELRDWLDALGYVDIKNANFRRYGMGATEIWIKG